MTVNSQANSAFQCKALRKDGVRCRGRALKGELCFTHAPEFAKARAEGSSRGGHALQAKLKRTDLTGCDLSTSEGIATALERVGYALLLGRMDATDARTLVAVLSKLAEVRDLRAIEESLDEAEG